MYFTNIITEHIICIDFLNLWQNFCGEFDLTDMFSVCCVVAMNWYLCWCTQVSLTEKNNLKVEQFKHGNQKGKICHVLMRHCQGDWPNYNYDKARHLWETVLQERKRNHKKNRRQAQGEKRHGDTHVRYTSIFRPRGMPLGRALKLIVNFGECFILVDRNSSWKIQLKCYLSAFDTVHINRNENPLNNFLDISTKIYLEHVKINGLWALFMSIFIKYKTYTYFCNLSCIDTQ